MTNYSEGPRGQTSPNTILVLDNTEHSIHDGAFSCMQVWVSWFVRNQKTFSCRTNALCIRNMACFWLDRVSHISACQTQHHDLIQERQAHSGQKTKFFAWHSLDTWLRKCHFKHQFTLAYMGSDPLRNCGWASSRAEICILPSSGLVSSRWPYYCVDKMNTRCSLRCVRWRDAFICTIKKRFRCLRQVLWNLSMSATLWHWPSAVDSFAAPKLVS